MIAAVLLLISLFENATQDLIKTCPPSEDIPQCSCHQNVNFRIYCKELYNPWDLKAVTTKLSKYDVYQLRLDDSYLMYWPKRTFTHLHVKEIEMYNCEVLGLESKNGTEMFQGIENSLQRLYFYNVTGAGVWRWSPFTVLKGLRTFCVRRADLVNVGKEFSSISPESLRTVHLGYNKINYIHKDAFANHTALREWELPGNEIVDVSRDMLPRPANELMTIKLYENRIVTVPDDFFTEMPKLKYVFLSENRIKFLSEELFQPMVNLYAFILDLRDNQIFCCTTLKFLVEAEYRDYINGACSYPQMLRDTDLRSLTEVDLDHGLC